MEDHFWKHLPRPAFTLAPMEDVTDTVFREIVMSISAAGCLHVLFTEFTSTDGLCHEIGGPKVRHRLRITETERTLLKKSNIMIVAQIWGTSPEKFHKAAGLISEMGEFDGIDINLGCPVKKIVKQGGCSALIAQPGLAKEIIIATKEGSPLPVSIKTRIGINRAITEEWIGHLLETAPSAITIHGRTQKQQSLGEADWNEVKKAVDLRNSTQSQTLIHGNGDVFSLEQGHTYAAQYHTEGIMIGRGIFMNPWFFNSGQPEKTAEERLALLWKHASLFSQTWGDEKHFAIMKRFFKVYASGFPDAAKIRAALMECNHLQEVEKVLTGYGIRCA